MIIWLTGLSGAGKTTIAEQLASRIDAIVIDGDDMREGISADLGFDEDARRENVRRAAHIAKMINDQGQHVIVALMSPDDDMREYARQINTDFHLVHVDCSLDTCKQRDPKGIYKRFSDDIVGDQIKYDIPTSCIRVDTQRASVMQCVYQILRRVNHGMRKKA